MLYKLNLIKCKLYHYTIWYMVYFMVILKSNFQQHIWSAEALISVKN